MLCFVLIGKENMVMERMRKFHSNLRYEAKARLCAAVPSPAKAQRLLTVFPGAGHLAGNLPEACVPTRPIFLIQDVGDTQQVPGRPNVDVDLLCRPGIGMPETCADELDRYTFSVQGRGEIMPKRMRTEPRYPGVPGKFFTEAVHTVS